MYGCLNYLLVTAHKTQSAHDTLHLGNLFYLAIDFSTSQD